MIPSRANDPVASDCPRKRRFVTTLPVAPPTTRIGTEVISAAPATLTFGNQHTERSQRPDRDEVEVHQPGLAQRQAMHVGLGRVGGLSVHQEHHARGVQLEPHLFDDAIEIELQSGPNLLRQKRSTLLGAGSLGPLADAQNLHCHVSEVEGSSSVCGTGRL
jgi:hypothetical protein